MTEATRNLVDTGVSVLLGNPSRILDRGLPVDDVFDHAGVSRATFYRRFASKDRYLAAVVDALVASGWPTLGDIAPSTTPVLDSRLLVDRYLELTGRNLTVARQLLALIFGRSSEETRRAVRDAYAARDVSTAEAFGAVLGPSVTLRKPFTVKNFPIALSATLDGLLLRRHADPDSVPAQLIADVLRALTTVAAATEQSAERIEDPLDTTPEAAPPSDARSALIDAARIEFAKHGYFGARVDTIAAVAGVPIEGTRKLFPTKTHFIVGALHSRFVALQHGIADDGLLGFDAIAILHNHFRRCAQLVLDEPAFMDALIAVVSHDTSNDPDSMLAIKEALNLPGLIAPVIESGQRAGTFGTEYPAIEFAAMMTNTLLLRCFTRRSHSPDEIADFTRVMVLEGLRAR